MNWPPVRVRDGLWRSGRYTPGDLRAFVAASGVRVVVDLRQIIRPPLASERTYQAMGVDFHRVPIDEDQPLPVETFEQVRGLIHGGGLIHCWKGIHRTGTICAMLRVVDGLDPAEAWNECHAFGFGGAHRALEAGFWGWVHARR